MNLLADENIDRAIVEWLRVQGHDVSWVFESAKRASDTEILKIANTQHCVLITADLDFGKMVFRQGMVSQGIVLLRLRAAFESERLQLFQQHWPQIESRAENHFVVAANRKLRIRALR